MRIVGLLAATGFLVVAIPAVRAGGPALDILFFTASWCEPCRAVYPILSTFEKKHRNNVRVVQVDFEQQPAEAERWGVHEIPVVIAIARDGRILFRAEGTTLRNLPRALRDALERAGKNTERR